LAGLSLDANAKEAVPLLRTALKSEDPLERRNALKALQQIEQVPAP
jgi:HEAT repeat protein